MTISPKGPKPVMTLLTGQTGEEDGERRRSGKGDDDVIKLFSSTFSLTQFSSDFT